MESAFITTTPALKGRVKQRYSDFVVEEVLTDGEVCTVERFTKTWQERGEQKEMVVPERGEEEHLLVNLEKINTDTSAALALLARGLNLSKQRIGYAGLKDKRAITCQRISLYMPDPERVKRFGVKGLEIRNPRWSANKVELGELKGNKFVITIRDISVSEEEIKKIVEEFITQAKKGLPNFFGMQRFGGKRQITHRVGKLMLEDKFEEAIILYLTDTYEDEKEDIKQARINFAKTRDVRQALREFPFEARPEKAMLNHLVRNPEDYAGAFRTLPTKVQYLFSHAFQSDIFNKMLTERIQKYGKKALEPIEGDILENGIPMLLIPGFESTFAPGKAGEIEKEIMDREKITFESFRTSKITELSSKGMRKEIALFPQDFKLDKIANDEFNEGKKAIVISFFLTKGNYATTVLRELLKEEIF
ncbi:MAG: tRNA pseudouridine(13) synthase TruD [archaeon]|jgi:tRNA pseudouridine13 synthase